MTRHVTDYKNQSTYRAYVEPAKKGIFRKREGFRFVVERVWSQLGPDGVRMDRPENWSRHKRGPWRLTAAEAAGMAEEWLDSIEVKAEKGDYL